MIGLLLKIGMALAPSLLPMILGWFGISIDDERDKERKAGEKLGQEETENANAQKELDEVTTAVEAGDAERTAVDADPGRLRDPANPVARPYQPGPG